MSRTISVRNVECTFVFLLSFSVCNLFAQAPAPAISANGIVNNASYAPGSNALAPGSIAAIFGSNLTDGTSCVQAAGCNQTFDSNGRLGTTMRGAQVTVNGSPVPIFYATPQQLGVQLPTALTGTSATLQVTVNGQTSPALTFFIDAFSPGIFAANQQGRGAGAITHADGTTVSSTTPARPGEVLVIYATGLGQVTPALATGARPTGTVTTLTRPTVTIDGLPATVQFSGVSGCCVGLNQVNVVVPSNVRTGTDVNVVLSIGGKQSNIVTIAVGSPPPPPPPPPINLTGSWQGTWRSVLGVGGFVIASIMQDGSTLNGTVAVGSSPCFSNGSVSGSFIGTTVVLNLAFPSNQRVNFSGTTNSTGTSMSGTYVTLGGLCDGDSGSWSATKVN